MNLFTALRLIGLVCWLYHTLDHRHIATSVDEETGETTERWHCTECGQNWEINP